MAISLIILITGVIGYFMAISDRVDVEIKVLGGTQATSFLKSDIQESIKRTLKMGNHEDCLAGIPIRDLFQNFLKTDAESVYSVEFKKPAGTAYNTWIASNGVKEKISCFFHPGRYSSSTEFDLMKISFKRSGKPNYINLSNYIQAEVFIRATTAGRSTNLKYILRYQIDVLSMTNYGVIFATTGTDPVFDLGTDSSMVIDAKTLVEKTDRTGAYALTNLSDFDRMQFNQKVFITGRNITADVAALNFLSTKNLRDYFKEGIIFDALDVTQPVPWRQTTNQYKDLFNYDLIASSRYPLPQLTSGESAIASSSSVTHTYANDKDNNPLPFGDNINNHNQNTAGIYELMTGAKKDLWKSCSSADMSTGVYNIIIFNNLDKDFTIDFSDNNSAASPPVFCGLIAARNLNIILNNTEEAAGVFTHHVIGKLLIKEKIKVTQKGKVIFTDVVDLDADTVNPYTVIDDHTSVQVQYFNQKYYSSQNFTLPFFKTASIYSDTAYTTSQDRFYVPRDTKELFTRVCDTKKCRVTPLGSPPTTPLPDEFPDILNRHRLDLVYEVTNVE